MNRKATTPDAGHAHVHGPDCDHDGHEHDGHEHHHEAAMPFRRTVPKQGRNDPCACGSGLKYKRCHGSSPA